MPKGELKGTDSYSNVEAELIGPNTMSFKPGDFFNKSKNPARQALRVNNLIIIACFPALPLHNFCLLSCVYVLGQPMSTTYFIYTYSIY